MEILAISTNTRLLGLAVHRGTELVTCKLCRFPDSWSPHKATLFPTGLEPCVRQYSIKTVILSIPPLHHQTKEWWVVRDRLCAYFELQGIRFYEMPQTKLYALCPPPQKRTKVSMMEHLCQHYPQLTRYYKRELRSAKRYYMKLFEAVGTAHLYQTSK